MRTKTTYNYIIINKSGTIPVVNTTTTTTTTIKPKKKYNIYLMYDSPGDWIGDFTNNFDLNCNIKLIVDGVNIGGNDIGGDFSISSSFNDPMYSEFIEIIYHPSAELIESYDLFDYFEEEYTNISIAKISFNESIEVGMVYTNEKGPWACSVYNSKADIWSGYLVPPDTYTIVLATETLNILEYDYWHLSFIFGR